MSFNTSGLGFLIVCSHVCTVLVAYLNGPLSVRNTCFSLTSTQSTCEEFSSNKEFLREELFLKQRYHVLSANANWNKMLTQKLSSNTDN
ncbi:hypothetical protein Y032_0001g56 [Ancylostoma ceylanicum]|uniref:Uncharacterized protein n=1 Tax=Ancylostoma ceylanicum TaxID=53326 RepID=A0A016W4W9_9BILA|nr:hypothetical protein Y032_0001g56 [Ancylostoma ceylanicum]